MDIKQNTAGVIIILLHCIVQMVSALKTEPQSESKTELEIMAAPYETMNTPFETMTPPKDYLTRDVDKVMLPLYDATHYFIQDALNPPSLLSLNSTYDLAEWKEVGDAFYGDWVGWMDHYLNYVMCMTAAAIYIIFLITCTTCTCCCRLRGQCGSYDTMDGKHAKCKRWTCGIFLIVVNLVILLGVVGAFIANQLVWEQTVTSGMTDTFHTSLQQVQIYQNRTELAYLDLDQETDSAYLKTSAQLDQISQHTETEIDNIYNITRLLDELERQSELLLDIIAPIQRAANLTEEISKFESDFELELSDIQTSLQQDLESCSLPDCKNVTDVSNSIVLQTNFSSLPDISNSAEVFTNLTMGETTIFLHINTSKASYETLSRQIDQQITNETDRLQDSTEEMYTNLKFLLNYTVEDVLRKYDLEAKIQDFKENTQSMVANDGDIRYFCCLALGILALMVVVFGFVALGFGICGERAGDDPGFCNRGRGANILKLTMVFMTVFGIVCMGGITLFFILGTITHNDVCRPSAEPQKVPSDTLQALDYAISKHLEMKMSFRDFIQRCSLNQTLYTAVQIAALGSSYNITEILNLDNYNISDDFDTIKTKNYTIEIIILSTELEDDLDTIDVAFSDMELEHYDAELSKQVTNVNMLEFALYLEELGSIYNGTNDTLSDIFFDYAAEYEQLYEMYIVPMEDNAELLKTELEPIIQVDKSFNASRFSDELSRADNAINTGEDVSDIIKDFTGALQQDYQDFTVQTTEKIEVEIGPTATLFEAFQESTVSFCVMFLYPFNAFWFSIGWCLMWYLPLLLIDLCLIDVYNKTEEYTEIFRGVTRSSFHRQRPPKSKGKRGKSKTTVIAGITLDHDPGCTDDDEDIDLSQYGHHATTSFHGNDAFGYHGRTIDDDALEYFGNNNLRILSRNRGISDGFLPPATRSQTNTSQTDTSNTSRSNDSTTQLTQSNIQSTTQATIQSTTRSVSSTQMPEPAVPVNQQSGQSTRAINQQTSAESANSDRKSDSSSDGDEKSVNKSTLEHVSHRNTYPVRERPTQPDVVSSVTANVPQSQTYGNDPEASKSNTRKPIPTPFLAGAANYAFDQGSDSNEEFVDEQYVLQMRRTSQRMSREREKSKQKRGSKEAKRLEREAKRAQKRAQVEPWYVEGDRQSRHNDRPDNVHGNTQDDGQNNRQNRESEVPYNEGTRPKQRGTVYEQNRNNQSPYPVYNQIQPPSYRRDERDVTDVTDGREPPNTEANILQHTPEVTPRQHHIPQTYNPDQDTGSAHNVKPSEVKKRLTQPDPLKFWQPPPPPPIEDDDAFNYPPVSALASSPARNYSRPAAAIQPYSHAAQRSPSPSSGQAFSYLLSGGDRKKSGYTPSQSAPSQSPNQGQGQSQGQRSQYEQNRDPGQRQGQGSHYKPYNTRYDDAKYDNTEYENTRPGFMTQSPEIHAHNPVKPFSYTPQKSGFRERSTSRGSGSGSYPRTDYIRQVSDGERSGYVNAAYF